VNAVRRRAAFGQNFLRRPETARLILRHTTIHTGDRVYDLGAGTGILTDALMRAGANVVAVECDPNLACKLRRRFGAQNVTETEGDLAHIAFGAPYKVVANIPFGRTAVLLRRLLFETPHPEEALLLLQREAAEKYAGRSRMTVVSLMAMPWFALEIVHQFAPRDFVPAPAVDTVLLRIAPRRNALLAEEDKPAWHAFIRHALERSKPEARKTFRDVLSNLQWRRLCEDLAIAREAALRDLTGVQWIGIYRAIRLHAPARKQRRFAVLP
jgi:16S rRNA A1518/A1519 N6-dimethyltransferase RsmA/KsgA/DIM1 with predicted DNA glycosylase/AP lyase activity